MTQTESLMTPAAQTNNAVVASTESPTRDVLNAVVTQDQPVAEDATDTGNTEGDSKDAPKTEAVGAPEKYEFKPPEGKNFDNEIITTYSQVARELNLSQASAQKMLDTLGPKSLKGRWLKSILFDKDGLIRHELIRNSAGSRSTRTCRLLKKRWTHLVHLNCERY